MKAQIAFISGHRDITDEEFNEYYIPKIDKAIEENHSFVIGNYCGVDYMAQKYLHDRGVEDVMIFHMASDNNLILDGFSTLGGFIDDESRDAAMMLISDYDIAWVREGKEDSGTAQNLKRRELKNKTGFYNT